MSYIRKKFVKSTFVHILLQFFSYLKILQKIRQIELFYIFYE